MPKILPSSKTKDYNAITVGADDATIPQYTPQEIAYRNYLIERMMAARDMRDKQHTEFNGQTYQEWYETNAKASYSFVPEKKNKQDVRIVSGVTEEKELSMMSAILNFNFEANIQAFDKDNIFIYELGETMQDLIKKSREIEKPIPYQFKRADIYKEMLDQGNVFVEEVWSQQIQVRKNLKKKINWAGGVRLADLKWEKDLKALMGRCSTNLLSGSNVYLGNIRDNYIQTQPFVYTTEILPYKVAQSQFQKWERWHNVPRKLRRQDSTYSSDFLYRDWTLFDHNQDTVEKIVFQDPWSNELMIMLNGVMMLPAEFPLTAISPSGMITIAKGDLQKFSKWFAYSKSIAAKTKIPQAVYDEFLRLLILKTQQSLIPPVGNNTGRTLSRDIFMPGKITKGIRKQQVEPLLDARGVTPAEFGMFQTIKAMIDEMSVSNVFEGQPGFQPQTATEILELKKQTMQKLGYAVLGVMGLEWQLSQLRLHNILHNWTKEIDTRVVDVQGNVRKIYQSVTIDTNFKSGESGKRVVEFTDQNLPEPEQIEAEEGLLTRVFGETVRKNYINPDMFDKLGVWWFFNIEPTPRETDELERTLFFDRLTILQNGFEQRGQALNYDYLKQEAARAMKKDKDQLFLEAPEGQGLDPLSLALQNGPIGQSGGREGGEASRQVANGVRRPSRPSVNTQANA